MIREIIISILITSIYSYILISTESIPTSPYNYIQDTSTRDIDGVKITSRNIPDNDHSLIVKLIMLEVDWIYKEGARIVAESAMSIPEDRVESHYIFQSFPDESSFKYTLINFSRSNGRISMRISYEVRNMIGVYKRSIYHSSRSSYKDQPFDKEYTVVNSDNESEDFHKEYRDRLMDVSTRKLSN